MKKLVSCLFLIFALAGCEVSDSQANRAIRDMGLTDIQLGSYSLFGCGEDHSFSREFSATQPANNRRVNGVVCCSYTACSVRTR